VCKQAVSYPAAPMRDIAQDQSEDKGIDCLDEIRMKDSKQSSLKDVCTPERECKAGKPVDQSAESQLFHDRSENYDIQKHQRCQTLPDSHRGNLLMVGCCERRCDPIHDRHNGIADKLNAECGDDKREDRKQCETALIITLHAFERIDKTIAVPGTKYNNTDDRIRQEDIIPKIAVVCSVDSRQQRIEDADKLSAQDIV